jgi:hypothetical protein
VSACHRARELAEADLLDREVLVAVAMGAAPADPAGHADPADPASRQAMSETVTDGGGTAP